MIVGRVIVDGVDWTRERLYISSCQYGSAEDSPGGSRTGRGRRFWDIPNHRSTSFFRIALAGPPCGARRRWGYEPSSTTLWPFSMGGVPKRLRDAGTGDEYQGMTAAPVPPAMVVKPWL